MTLPIKKSYTHVRAGLHCSLVPVVATLNWSCDTAIGLPLTLDRKAVLPVIASGQVRTNG
jgi:hypothetical protein